MAVDLGRAPRIPRADLDRLFRGYTAVLALMLDPPASVIAPRWVPADRIITLALFKLRPSFARTAFVVRHIRRNIGVIERAYCRRIATGHQDDNDEEELELVRHFADSLPPAPPRWVPVSAVIATLLLAQALSSPQFDPQFDLRLTSIASPDATSLYDLAGTLTRANREQLASVVLSLSLACYLVLRGPVSGHRMARMLLNAPRALTRRNRNSPLAAQSKHWDVYGEEHRLLTALRQPRPRDPPLDLLVKAALFASPWFACVADPGGYISLISDSLRASFAEFPDAGLLLDTTTSVALVIATPPRLAWLSVAAVRRRQATALLATIAVVTLLPFVAASAHADPDGEQIVRLRVEQSETVPALASALEDAIWNDDNHGLFTTPVRGVDLRGRNMRHMNLRGVDFMGAQLSDTNLAFSRLADSCLQQVVLRNANLAGADLRFADLRGADLRGANLHRAKLKDSGHDAQTRWPAGYPGQSGSLRARRSDHSRCDFFDYDNYNFDTLRPKRHWVGRR